MTNESAWKALGVVMLALLASGRGANRQTARSPKGEWRGSSVCLIHPSPCHDESVVYRIAPMKAADSVSFDALKIVNGREEDMGTLTCHVASPVAQLVCPMPRGVWRFTVRGDSLIGDLRLPDGTRFRDVRAARSRAPSARN